MEHRYWDSDAFLGWLKKEPDKKEACREVLERAEAGEILLVTSALTLTEVVKLKGGPHIEKKHSETIKQFFINEYISVRNVDRWVAELARELVWNYEPLKPKDSIHVATAIRYEVPLLNTFDAHLLLLNEKIGNPPLQIVKPSVSQPKLTGFSEAEEKGKGQQKRGKN